MYQQFLIVLSGPPASGKNAIASEVGRHFPNALATIDLDQLKAFVALAPRTDPFLDLAAEAARSLTKIYLNNNLSVLIHNAFCKYSFVEPFLEIASNLGVRSFYFKLTAPLDILLHRNETRARPCAEDDIRRIYALDSLHSHPAGVMINTLTCDTEEAAGIILRALSSAPSPKTSQL